MAAPLKRKSLKDDFSGCQYICHYPFQKQLLREAKTSLCHDPSNKTSQSATHASSLSGFLTFLQTIYKNRTEKVMQ